MGKIDFEKAKEGINTIIDENTQCYIVCSDKGLGIEGNKGHFLSMLTEIIRHSLERNYITEEDLKFCIELAKKSDEELEEEVIKSLGTKKALKDMLKEILND